MMNDETLGTQLDKYDVSKIDKKIKFKDLNIDSFFFSVMTNQIGDINCYLYDYLNRRVTYTQVNGIREINCSLNDLVEQIRSNHSLFYRTVVFNHNIDESNINDSKTLKLFLYCAVEEFEKLYRIGKGIR